MVRADLIEALTKSDADVCPPNFTDHVYKQAHGVDIGARVWPAPSNFKGPRPFITWIHGGGWIGGAHFTPRPWLVPAFHSLGYHIIGGAYRLCPNVDVETGLNDCLDFVAWCRKELPGVIGEDRVDVDRYSVLGESAGGHLVTLMATRLEPPPKVVVDIYGVTDFLDPYTGMTTPPKEPYKPSSAPTATKSESDEEITPEEILTGLHDHDPAHALSDSIFSNSDLTRPLTKNWKVDFPITRRIRLQLAMQNSLSTPGTKYVGLFHPERFNSHEEVVAFIKSVSPMQILDGEEYTSGKKKYPPTAFLHGTADEPVPVDQTHRFAAKLKKLGTETVVCIEEGGPHVFDHVYSGPEIEGWKEYIQPVVDFVQKHIEA
jgi:acetyl esterase/lipase